MKDVADSDLSVHDKVELMAIALEDLALATALEVVHPGTWTKVYLEMGGKMRFVIEDDGSQEPAIWCEHNTSAGVEL
jgi:hypothetical protein